MNQMICLRKIMRFFRTKNQLMINKEFGRAEAELARTIADINQETFKQHEQLIYNSLQQYVNEVNDRFDEKGFTNAMIIVNGVHPNAKNKIQANMKKLAVKMPTRVIITFDDESMLDATFGDKNR